MSLSHRILDNAEAVVEAVCAEASARVCAGSVPVVIVRCSAALDDMRSALANRSCALGVRVETLSAWVADRWELVGDGRRIASPIERSLLVRRALEECPRKALEHTPGTVDLLSRLAREALPHLVSTRMRPDRSLGLAECEALAVLRRYAALLEQRMLCEEADAASLLPDALGANVAPLVLAGIDDMGYAHERMLDALADRTDVVRFDDGCRGPFAASPRARELHDVLDRLFDPVPAEPVVSCGDVRFLLPAGRYAQARLIAQAVVRAVAEERVRADGENRAVLPVAVACCDPRELFDEIADALAVEGIAVGVQARRPFEQTAFGCAFFALLSFAWGEEWSVSQASDFALSAFSGIDLRVAYELDEKWRGDRLISRELITADLANKSELAALVLDRLAREDCDGALAVFEARLRANTSLDAAFRAEQLAAVSCARGFVEACLRCDVECPDALFLLGRVKVSASAVAVPVGVCAEQGENERPEVRFMSVSEAAELPPCSCAELVLCDLTANAQPVRAVEDGGTLLLEKLGFARSRDALADARRQFFRILSCARYAVVCERVLNTVDGDEAYPAVMLEELIDCYRPIENGALAVKVDRATGLPASLAGYALVAGEDALHGNLAVACGELCSGSETLSWDASEDGTVSGAYSDRIVLSGRAGKGAISSVPPVLSPSALEAYLECPYKWFASRRLRLCRPDAGFGPKEMGSFSHSVLKGFYEAFQSGGRRKVDEGTLSEARALLRDTFDRCLKFQPESGSADALIPKTSFEHAEANDLEKKLVSYLDREAVLLPGFAPARFEFEFESLSYAGCLLRGSIDRIDTNDRGQAVVIDYKSSLNADYVLDSCSAAAQAAGAIVPHKVQTLIYAQVARRVLGVDVVGALYVSYGRDARVAGALDRMVLGEADVPGIDIDRCGVPGPAADALGVHSFSELVDAVEKRIGCAVDALLKGCIAPDPRGTDPCGFCPVRFCERRRSA